MRGPVRSAEAQSLAWIPACAGMNGVCGDATTSAVRPRERGDPDQPAEAAGLAWIPACARMNVADRTSTDRGRLLRRGLPILFPQLEALDLSGRGAWQGGAQLDPARKFPRSRLVLDVPLQCLEQAVVGLVAVPEHDKCLRLDEPIGIFLADNGSFQHRLVRNQRRLHVERRHPHAAHLEHVVGAPAVIVVALGIAAILVAGVRPLAGEGAAALGALVPVAFAGRRSTYNELADLAVPNLAPVLVDDARVVSGDGLAGRAIANVAKAVGEEGVEHLG